MIANCDGEAAAFLDVCVDRLLAGEDWRSAITEPDADEIVPRMGVAEIVLQAARQSKPKPDAGLRSRIWRRLSRPLATLRRLENEHFAVSVTPAAVAGAFAGGPSFRIGMLPWAAS